MTCIFCQIAAGERSATMVYQDDVVVAFRDTNPQAPTHILIVPREHITGPSDLDETHALVAGHMLVVAAQIAREQGLAADGYRLVLNQGQHGGQSIFHLHLHLLGGRRMRWPPG